MSYLMEVAPPPPTKTPSSLGTILGALTAILTVLTGVLYFAGYLFLIGYYGRFSLPLNLLGLPVQTILTASGVVLVPLIAILALMGTYMLKDLGHLRAFVLNPWLYVIGFLFCVFMAALMPPTGRWFADAQLNGRFTAYSPFAEPIPWVSFECKQPIPGMPGGEPTGKEGAVTYKNLRIVAATEKYFYLYSEEKGTFLVPHESVLWMGFYSTRH